MLVMHALSSTRNVVNPLLLRTSATLFVAVVAKEGRASALSGGAVVAAVVEEYDCTVDGLTFRHAVVAGCHARVVALGMGPYLLPE